MSAPEFLVLGHVTRDLEPDGFRLGGTATYAGVLGARLGVRTAVVTSCAPDLLPRLESALAGVELRVRPSDHSTAFENRYLGSRRTQHIAGVAETLGAEDIPPAWRDAAVVLLGPVAGELRPDLYGAFRRALLGLTPQGMMRAWGADGAVHPRVWELPAAAGDVDVLVLSEDDLPDPALLERYTARVRIVAVTHAEEGATVYVDRAPRSFPASASAATDPTGAGDIFAAAFLLELRASGDVARAARFANAAASFVIEAPGTAGVPTRDQVERRLAAGDVRLPDGGSRTR